MSTGEWVTQTFQAADGVTLAYHEVGAGRPVVLLPGYMSAAREIWARTGIATRLADAGRRVIMPDLRGHGDSARSHDPDDYPRDALHSDAQELIAHLELGENEYDLAGYSLGGRIVARMLGLGAKPGRAVVGGTGLEPIVHAAGRGGNYRRILSNLGTFDPGSPDAQIEEYLASIDADPIALLLVLDTLADTPLEAFAAIDVPTLVIAGAEDVGRGSVPDLAAAIRGSRLREIPGDHVTALLSPEFSDELTRFLVGEVD